MVIIIDFDSRSVNCDDDVEYFITAIERLCRGYSTVEVLNTLRDIVMDNSQDLSWLRCFNQQSFIGNRLDELKNSLYPVIVDKVVRGSHVIYGYRSVGSDTFILLEELI